MSSKKDRSRRSGSQARRIAPMASRIDARVRAALVAALLASAPAITSAQSVPDAESLPPTGAGASSSATPPLNTTESASHDEVVANTAPAVGSAEHLLPLEPSDLLRAGAGRVRLRVRSSGVPIEVRVAPTAPSPERHRHPATSFVSVCETPCSLYIPAGRFTFETGGTRARLGHHVIEVPQYGATLTVRPSSSALVAAGHALLYAGLVNSWIGIGATVMALDHWYYHPPPFRTDAFVAGALTVASLGAMGLGIGLLAMNPAPHVTSMRAYDANGRAAEEVVSPELPRRSLPRRRYWGLFGAGAALFLGGYVTTSLFGLINAFAGGALPGYQWWFVPGPGPIVAVAIPTYRGVCGDCTAWWSIAIVATVVQTTSIAMMAFGALGIPDTSSRPLVSQWFVVPGAEGAPLGITLAATGD